MKALIYFSLAALFSGTACSGTNTERVIVLGATGGAGGALGTLTGLQCVPNATQACLGPGSCVGAQLCNATGSGFSSCVCGAVVGTGGTPGTGAGGTGAILNGSTGGVGAATGGVSGTGGSSCVIGPGPANACWYLPWANGSCTASLVSAAATDIAAAFSDESSSCNAGIGFSGANDSTLNLSAYSYVSVSAQAGSGSYFNVQLTDASGNYCYWSFTGNGANKTYLVDLSSPTYCGLSSIAKALVTNVDFTTNYDYTGDFTMHILSVNFI